MAELIPSVLRHELADFFGRALLVVRGADDARWLAEKALAKGDAIEALSQAQEVLARVPGSPVGLLLAADAAEAASLDETACGYLGTLAEAVPWSHDVWLRLGLARLRTRAPVAAARDALARAAMATNAPACSARAATVLADLDLTQGDAARALVWLDAVTGDASEEVSVLRALALLDLGDVSAAQRLAQGLSPPHVLDARRALLEGRLALETHSATGGASLLRAYILDAPGAVRYLARAMPILSPPARAAVGRVVAARGAADQPLFRAAVAFSQGDRDTARRSLVAASEQGDIECAHALIDLAMEDHDAVSLRAALKVLDDPMVAARTVETAILRAHDELQQQRVAPALDALDEAGTHSWARTLRTQAFAQMMLASQAAPGVAVDELRRAARLLDDAPARVDADALTAALTLPLRATIMGEFNAGKSTFLNALLGAEIAPTGVLPTTATLHHVVFSPDPFARVVVENGPDRVVAPERLRTTLDEIIAAGAVVQRVTLGLPLERLRSIEILDTPGFNAPAAAHADTARSAFDEADVALWLADASQPLKESERAVLAEAQRRGLPVQVLLNKIDRLDENAVAGTYDHVVRGLDRARIRSLVPPLIVSARLALRGRLGDNAALAQSGWGAVEAFLETTLVLGANRLKHAALLRRARVIALRLAQRAREVASSERATAKRKQAEKASLLEAARKLTHARSSLLRPLERALHEPRALLAEDLAPLATRGDALPPVRAYATSRAVLRLVAPMSDALLANLPEVSHSSGVAREVFPPVITAALHGIVAALPRPFDIGELPVSRLLDAIAEPAALGLRERALAVDPPRDAVALVARLEAFCDAVENHASLG